jgi:hypothetical protein
METLKTFNISEYPCFVKRDVLRKEIEALGINVNCVYDMYVSEVQTYKHGKYVFVWRTSGVQDLMGDNIKDLTEKQKEDLVYLAANDNSFIYNVFVIPISIFDKTPYIGFPADTYSGDVISKLKWIIGELKKDAEQYIDRFLSYNEYIIRLSIDWYDGNDAEYEFLFKQNLQNELFYITNITGRGDTYRFGIDNKISKLISENFKSIIDNFKLTSYTRNESRDREKEVNGEKILHKCYETDYIIKLPIN